MAHKFLAKQILKDMQHSLDSLEIDVERYEEIRQENIKLRRDLEEKTKQFNIMEQEMKQQREELNNMSKVSMIQSINKQLEEKISYIKILESQLDKLRIKKPIEPIPEVHYEPPQEVSPDVTYEEFFDPDEFEEINGYELLVYKKNYYLRDLETDELYSIQSNKPRRVVGLINNKGKIRLQ